MWLSKIHLPKINKETIFPVVRSYAIITFGLFINALGWTVFLIPAEITSGGLTGVSSLLFYAFEFHVGITYLLINGLLILLSIRFLGKSFGLKTIFATAVLSLFLSLLEGIVTEPIVDENFMSAVVGGILAGAGVGLAISQGGSTGGTDIIAMMVNKHKNISPGKILLYLDIIIISSTYLVYSHSSSWWRRCSYICLFRSRHTSARDLVSMSCLSIHVLTVRPLHPNSSPISEHVIPSTQYFCRSNSLLRHGACSFAHIHIHVPFKDIH